MKKTLIITTAVIFFLFQSVSAQNQSNESLRRNPICNGLATYLPKPEQVKPSAINVSGIVNVQVSIDEQGDVVLANAVSGHPLLRPLAEKAALKAKFRQTTFSGNPVKVNCVIVYNFVPEQKFIEKDVINSAAIYLPLPKKTKEAQRACIGGKVEVAVLIDATKGEVIFAEAISGNELLRKSSEEAALQAKFKPALINGANIYVKAKLVYEFAQPKCIQNETLNQKALSIPKPLLKNIIDPKHFSLLNTVVVQISIDAKGDVIFAKAVSGHPALRPACETSARQAKFPAAVDALLNKPLTGIIIYKIKSDGTVEF